MLLQSPMSQLQSVSIPHLSVPEAGLEDMAWDIPRSYPAGTMDVAWNCYTLPPSPSASVSSNDSPQLRTELIKPSDSLSSDGEQQSCLPTNKVFDIDLAEAHSSSSSASPPLRQLTLSLDGRIPPKKPFSTIGGVKKGRGSGERITTKDFVPPDVTGLSKREARLLKNRAAAFLSRQRKREEFEAMEIRVRELEEENSRLQALAEKAKKYDDLLSSMEQLRLRLSMAEKREQELTVEFANRTGANLAVKSEPHDLNIPSTSYASYVATGQASIISTMKQSLLSSLPSLLSLPSQTSLPVSFSIPLTGSTARHSSSPFAHHSVPCDTKDHAQSRYGHGSVGFQSSSADAEPLKKLTIGGEPLEAIQFDVDGHHYLGSLSIALDALPTEDGRGCVRVHISERVPKPATHGNRQTLTSHHAWPGMDGSFSMTSYTSPPLSAPTSTPSSSSANHLGVFASTGNTHSRMGFETQLISSDYPPFAQHDPEQSFDYYPGLILD